MPTATMKFDVIILWEHELIKAARALEKVNCKDPKPEDFAAAFKACFAAIYSKALAEGKTPMTVLSCKTEIITSVTEIKA